MSVASHEMSTDPIDRQRIEREALEVTLAYYAGRATLQDALAAILMVGALPVPDGDAGDESGEAGESWHDVDRAAMSSHERERYDALTRAIEAHFDESA